VGYFALLLGGFLLLAAGGEAFVRGAVALSERLGISPLLIGLTLVGLGTSLPELVTSVQAAVAGSPGIAVGNIVGSSISNLLFILGLSALLTPMAVNANALLRDGTVVVLITILFALVSYAHALDRSTGMIFIALLTLYLLYAYRQEKSAEARPSGHTSAFERAQAYDEMHHRANPLQVVGGPGAQAEGSGGPILAVFFGLGAVVLGGGFLVDGAIGIARSYGIPETVIGLTIVAIGTSMPEFVTSFVAAIRGHSEVALGNIMGSSIYNILGIGGVTGLIQPTKVPADIVTFDNLVMIGASVAMLAFAWSGSRISRLEGAILLSGYVAYIFVLWPE
jgi:cation:H+ antiporter